MKFYALLASLLAFCSLLAAETAAPQSQITWITNFDEAKAEAKAESKPIFLYFTGSDWCPWCQQMDKQIFATSEFQTALADKMIFVKVDFPRKKILHKNLQDQNERLASKYGINGFPTIIMLDSNLQQIALLHFSGDDGASFAAMVSKIIENAPKKSPMNEAFGQAQSSI